MIMAWYRSNETSRRLHYIPGVGPLLATALVANVADPGVASLGVKIDLNRYPYELSGGQQQLELRTARGSDLGRYYILDLGRKAARRPRSAGPALVQT